LHNLNDNGRWQTEKKQRLGYRADREGIERKWGCFHVHEVRIEHEGEDGVSAN
jgi:hypothetical protein